MTDIIRSTPAGILADAAERKAFRHAFCARAHRKALSAADMALFALALGRPLDTVFTTVTNPVKLCNGAAPWFGAASALRLLAMQMRSLELGTSPLAGILAEAGLALRAPEFRAAAIAAASQFASRA